jgi:hypothetical protein
MNFKELCAELEVSIQSAYTTGVTMEDAEKLAAKFLYGQMAVSAELRKSALDARMRKTGLKAIRAKMYLEEVAKSERKPSDVLLDHMLNENEVVIQAQTELDEAESNREELERYYDMLTNGHIYFRGVAKGAFGG